MYKNLAVVQQKIYSYLTRFKNVAFHANFFYALRQRGPHHVVCLRAPTILNPPLGKCISDYFSISNGVRQGGILSPKLFSVYVDDLSDKLVESKVGCSIDNLCMNHVMYADDICLMAPSPAALQELINICYDFSVRNDLSFNSSKSYCMVFKPKSYTLLCPLLYMDSQVPIYADNVKYLGFTFSSDQKDDNDILRHLRMLYTKSNRLLRLFHHCSVDVKLALFRSYCTCFYCPFLWTHYKKSNYSKLRVAFNNVYRRILKLPSRSSASTMYVVNNIDSLEVLVRKPLFGFMERLNNSDNTIIKCINNSWILKISYELCNGGCQASIKIHLRSFPD